jgi:hypothetical protein
MPKEKQDIYPPSIVDPLLPGGIPPPEAVATDAYLGELAKENLSAPEDAGEEPPGVPPDNAPPAQDAPTSPPQAPPPGAADAPIDVLRGIAIGTIDPGTTQPVRGAAVEYCPRINVWRPAFAQNVAGISKAGIVLLDLVADTAGGGIVDVFGAPLGSGVGNWRFPLG